MTTRPPQTDLARQYNPADVEPGVLARWNAAHAYHADPDAPGDPYSIVIPPPNVTAALHLGHALNNTLQDILIRHHRMAGDNAMWMPGTDHAGIATQTVVEKRVLQEEGKRRTDFTREQFVEKIQAWKDEYEQRITHQLQEMGCSCDYDRQRFTMDPVCAAAVREAFFQLFKDRLIYRGKRLVNWDPVTQTALADDEVEMHDIDGHFWYMKYPIVDDNNADTGEFATVATTRPETMLGDTAVAVNPNDPERAHLIGKNVRLPIVNRIIPIVGDDHVTPPDPEGDERARFSSGFLKVTPAHDPNDYEIGQRHGLAMINIMAPDASISLDHGWPPEDTTNADAFLTESLVGLSREDARKQIVQWFKDHDLLAEVKPYRHAVGHSYRSHVPIEPYLSDQWYVKVTDDKLRGAALRAMAPEQRSETDAATSRDRKGAVPAQTYFISFTCYGNWLHGDERGSVDRHHNLPGTPHLIGDEEKEKQEFNQLKHPPMSLDAEARRVVQNAILEVCEYRGWRAHAVHVRPRHVHVVVDANATAEHAMNDFKAYATRRLREADLIGSEQRTWTRHGSTRYLNDDRSLAGATHYVIEEQGERLEPAPHDGRAAASRVPQEAGTPAQPLPHGRGSSADTWQGQLRFTPARYAKTFQTWHENIRDWCISRQLWWGHRIPVWSATRKTVEDRVGEEAWIYLGEDIHEAAEKNVLEFHTALNTEGFTREEQYELPHFICIRDPDGEGKEWASRLEKCGFEQDPDVLDTWFSSALWPMSTMGWPDPDAFPDEIPEGRKVLETWNPTSTLCTAREIITLWVSRMVMFNVYFRDCLPFHDVFIHAMIQDGAGQKMSKSLGNGVDPMDIIHSHGSDAMRFTLAAMTTHTQDVRLPVDMICPHTGETFTPETITTPQGYKVAAPIQTCPSDKNKKMVSSFGLASGQAQATDDMPLARNTSSKFDLGRNFANKLWNAVRFALGSLEGDAKPADAAAASAGSLADRWILSRLARTVQQADTALDSDRYEFSVYANALYEFFWRDLCDWYIEAVKPTVRESDEQRAVLAACIDVSLRLLHPVMPFITERLWAQLNAVVPERAVAGRALPHDELLIRAAWPEVGASLIDESAERDFELLQQVVTAARQVRTDHTVPPRQTVELSIKADAQTSERLEAQMSTLDVLAGAKTQAIGPDVQRPGDAAAAVVGAIELYLHGLVDAETERKRLQKRADELNKQIDTLQKRLANENYVNKAPAHLVQESRDQLASTEQELESVQQQLDALG